ncbi:rhodanese-like domain-containing protein [Altererythrobacter sp. GH1-8]|uniref:rhodanese-like domain-containing protein n=1 Tax=Altererythrobacter sp. GH1-8 TaxID=3349333 RepID=UPI00374CAD1F
MRRAAIIALAAAGLALAACTSEAAADDAAAAPVSEAAPKIETLDTAALAALLEGGSIRLIDVRTDEEVAEGIIPGAEHIALDRFDPTALDTSDGREVVLYCRSGRRSGIAAERLAEHTGETARHLEGGILEWQDAGLPLSEPD